MSGLSVFFSLLSLSQTQNAIANGDTRTINLYHSHTKESISATFRVNGQYDAATLEKLNWFLRDWRRDEATKMDPHLFDIVWEVYRETGSGEPITIVSAYRSPETNAMLRRRSRAVAKHSQHMLGKAMDMHYNDIPMSTVREIGMRLQKGGVGYYPTAGTPFVHLDAGSVRAWPRMNYDQLVRLFPDGKTVHLPSNGQPLARYEEARAEIEARGGNADTPTSFTGRGKSLFAGLFGGGDEDEEAPATSVRGRRAPPASATRTAAIAPTYGSGDDAGARSFFLNEAQRGSKPAAPTTIASAEINLPRGETFVQPGSPIPANAPKPTAGKNTSVTAAAEDTSSVTGATLPSNGIDHPAPPKRPIELALVPPADIPFPPQRPRTETASLASAVGLRSTVTPDSNTAGDPIGAMIGSTNPQGRFASLPGLPAMITRGTADGSTKAAPVPQAAEVLAYAPASGGAIQPLRPAAQARVQNGAKSLVSHKADMVAARIDRSNFRSLTATAANVPAASQAMLGSAIAPLRANAKPDVSWVLSPAVMGSPASFGAKTEPLAADHFALQPVQIGKVPSPNALAALTASN